MPLKDGYLYEDGKGHREVVSGSVRDHPEWAYTRAGNWFRRSDGHRVFFTPGQGHFVLEEKSQYDLCLSSERAVDSSGGNL